MICDTGVRRPALPGHYPPIRSGAVVSTCRNMPKGVKLNSFANLVGPRRSLGVTSIRSSAAGPVPVSGNAIAIVRQGAVPRPAALMRGGRVHPDRLAVPTVARRIMWSKAPASAAPAAGRSRVQIGQRHKAAAIPSRARITRNSSDLSLQSPNPAAITSSGAFAQISACPDA